LGFLGSDFTSLSVTKDFTAACAATLRTGPARTVFRGRPRRGAIFREVMLALAAESLTGAAAEAGVDDGFVNG
jgi:hypothetical protein